jgi:hypothetical protein
MPLNPRRGMNLPVAVIQHVAHAGAVSEPSRKILGDHAFEHFADADIFP